jgi:hypothetical protein
MKPLRSFIKDAPTERQLEAAHRRKSKLVLKLMALRAAYRPIKGAGND